MDCESGDHLALSASVAMVVSFLGLVVAPVAGSKSASQICWPLFAAAEEENALAVGGELEAAVAGLGDGELDGVATGDWLQPELRCFGVLSRSTVVTQ